LPPSECLYHLADHRVSPPTEGSERHARGLRLPREASAPLVGLRLPPRHLDRIAHTAPSIPDVGSDKRVPVLRPYPRTLSRLDRTLHGTAMRSHAAEYA